MNCSLSFNGVDQGSVWVNGFTLGYRGFFIRCQTDGATCALPKKLDDVETLSSVGLFSRVYLDCCNGSAVHVTMTQAGRCLETTLPHHAVVHYSCLALA
eukprot:7075614-Pyramimonas_sp.AAC.1